MWQKKNKKKQVQAGSLFEGRELNIKKIKKLILKHDE